MEPASRLKRNLTLFDATMMGTASMIGAGIFVLTGIAAGAAGPALILAFLLNGFMAILTAFSYAELGACFPEAGGNYLWAKQGLPRPNGFIGGWLTWFAFLVGSSLYGLGFGSYFYQMLDYAGIVLPGSREINQKLLAVIIVVIYALINRRGATEAGKTGNIFTGGKLIILLFFIASGLVLLAGKPGWAGNLTPFMPQGIGGVLVAMGITATAFKGFEAIAQSGEEVREPERNIPRAIFISLAIVIPIKLLVAFVCLTCTNSGGNIPTWVYLGAHAELAVLDAAQQFMPVGGYLILLGGLLATMSALNATFYSSSRVSFAMGTDVNLPDIFASIDPKHQTPRGAIIVSTIIIILMAVTLPIQDVASATSIMFLLIFIQVNLSAITLRYRRPDLRRSFKIPLFPVPPILASITQLCLVVTLVVYSPKSMYISIAWLILGGIIYYNYSAHREKESTGSKVYLEEFPLVPGRSHILVALRDYDDMEELIPFAKTLAQTMRADLLFLHVIPLLEPLDSLPRKDIENAKLLLKKAIDTTGELNVHTMIRSARYISQGIEETALEKKSNLILAGWNSESTSEDQISPAIDPLIRSGPSDLALFKGSGSRKGWKRILGKSWKRITVGVTGSPHGLLAARIATIMGTSLDIPVRYVHIIRHGTAMDEETADVFLTKTVQPDPIFARIEPEIYYADSVIDQLLNLAAEDDLLIIGAGTETYFEQKLFGHDSYEIAQRFKGTALLVKKYEGRGKSVVQSLFQPLEESNPSLQRVMTFSREQ